MPSAPSAGGIPEPLASVPAARALPSDAAVAASPPQGELLNAAQDILRRRGAELRPCTTDSQWALLHEDSGAAAGFCPQATVAPEAAYAVIVDHALRPESAAEAAATAEAVAAWGLRPLLLTASWPRGPPRHGELMKTARLVRQRLYLQACRQHGISDLLVGHQAGAQDALFASTLHQCS